MKFRGKYDVLINSAVGELASGMNPCLLPFVFVCTCIFAVVRYDGKTR